MHRRNACFASFLLLAGACDEGGGEVVPAPAESPSAESPSAPESTQPTGSTTPATPPVEARPESAHERRRRALADAPPPPPPVERSGTKWPFHPWDRAEAVTYNSIVPQRIQLRVYDEHGWSSRVIEKKPLDPALANKALKLVHTAGGEMEVSKCPFPRHAVVLYSDDVPIASINVCFECGDILLWPRWEPKQLEAWSSMSERQLDRAIGKYAAFNEKMISRWRVFFRDEVGFHVAEAKH